MKWSGSDRRHMARRQADRAAQARRVAWWLLVAVLIAVIAIAWCSVPEPELLQAGW